MGLFSSKLIVNTHASTYPLLDQSEEFISSFEKYMMLGATNPDISIAQAIQANIKSNPLSGINKYIREAKNSYAYKLPTTKLYHAPSHNEPLISNLIQLTGATVLSSTFTASTEMEEAANKLYEKYGDFRNISTVSLVIGTEHTWEVDSYQKGSSSADPQKDFFTFTTSESLLVQYKDTSTNSIHTLARHFTNDVLNNIYTQPFNDAFPVIPVILDKAYLDDFNETAYSQAKDLLWNIGLDLEAIKKQIKENNPNGGERDYRITDAFLMHGIHIYTQSQAGLEYLFNMFDALIPGTSVTNQTLFFEELDYNFKLSFSSASQERRAITITDKYVGWFNGSTYTVQRNRFDGSVDEIQVQGLSAQIRVDTHANITKTVNVPITTDTDSAEYANFRIPLDHTIFKSIARTSEKEKLLHECAMISLHHTQVYYQKWYESGIIGDIITVIAVVAAIWTGGASLTLLGLKTMVYNLILAQLLKAIVFELTDDPIIRAIASIAIDAMIFGFGEGSTTFQDIGTVLNGINAGGQSYFQLEYASLEQEIEDFTKSVEEIEEQLKNAKDLLDPGPYADVLMANLVSRPRIGEVPDAFYTRSLNKNPGAAVVGGIRRYYDNALSLPKVAPMASAQYSQLPV